MLTIHADVPLTRRKTMHHVVASDGTLLFSSRTLMHCMDYCFEKGYCDVLLKGDPEQEVGPYLINLRPGDRAPEIIPSETTP
jgi:hypothetical protein